MIHISQDTLQFNSLVLQLLNARVLEMQVQAIHVCRFFNRVQCDGIANGVSVEIPVKYLSLLSVVMKEKGSHLKIELRCQTFL